MANVLRRVEDLKRKTVQKFSLGEQASYRFKPPACSRFKEGRDIFQLRNLIRPEADFLFKLIDCPVEFLACMCLEHLREMCVAELPGLYLIFRILELGYGLVHLVSSSNVIDLFSAFAIGNISEPGVVSVLDSVTL